MGDPIYMCDIILRDTKSRRDIKVDGVVLSGNDKDLMWEYDLYKRRILSRIYKTKNSLERALQSKSFFVKHIEFKVFLGYSNISRGVTS